jgi:EpsI family protein
MNWRRVNILLAIVVILGAAAAAQAMIPRRHFGEAPTQASLEEMIPKSFGQWTYDPSVQLVQPPGDTLEKQIYSAELARGFRDPAGHLVMLLIAYGASQSDRLQMHRPEICYSAQGFRVSKLTTVVLNLGDGLPPLPVRHLTAQREDRLEPITYWMRLGDTIATGPVERQILKVKYGLGGYIADGALMRVSTVNLPPELGFEVQSTFIRDLMQHIDGKARQFLIGDINRSVGLGF